MLTRLKRVPSPALAISLLALLLALGGGAYAVSSLPKHSVGTKQLKKNAVVSSKVKNHSLLGKDFKAGQLPAGPRGATGPQGPSNAYLRYANSGAAVGTSATDVATLSNLPAGNYTLQATVQVENSNASVRDAGCGFALGTPTGPQHPFNNVTGIAGGGGIVTIPIVDTASFSGASNSVSVRCSASGSNVSANTTTIVATAVGSLTENRDPFRG